MTICAATSAGDGFILGLVECFSEFPLPPDRDPACVTCALRRNLAQHLHERPITSYFFVIKDAGERTGFVHPQLVDDVFGAGLLCHISDLAVTPAHEGRGHARPQPLRASRLRARHAEAGQTAMSGGRSTVPAPPWRPESKRNSPR